MAFKTLGSWFFSLLKYLQRKKPGFAHVRWPGYFLIGR